MTRDPMLDEAWTDIERALEAANVALEPPRAAATPARPADRRWQAWALAAASLFFAVAVAYQLFGGAR